MQVTKKQEDGIDIFSLKGRFDAHCAADVEEKLNSAISKGAKKLLLDLEETEYVSSAGLRVLLATAKRLKKEGGVMKLCALQPYVKEVFDTAGFTQIFAICNTTKEAMDNF